MTVHCNTNRERPDQRCAVGGLDPALRRHRLPPHIHVPHGRRGGRILQGCAVFRVLMSGGVQLCQIGWRLKALGGVNDVKSGDTIVTQLCHSGIPW
jgi:hypothetical protein